MNSITHKKSQKFSIFVNKNLKINMLQIINIVDLGTNAIIQKNIQVLYIISVI